MQLGIDALLRKLDSQAGHCRCAELGLTAQLGEAELSLSGGSGLPMSYRLQPLARLLFACHKAGWLQRPTP